MKISVKNLAQISEAEDIEIKDFNIFIGKNGTGKTYFSKLIYFLNNFSYKMSLAEKFLSKKVKTSFDSKTNVVVTMNEQKAFIVEFNNYIKNKYSEFIGSKKEIFNKFSFSTDINILEDIIIECDETIENLRDYSHYITIRFIMNAFNITDTHYLPAARANYMITYKHLFESEFNNFRDVFLNKKRKKKISILPEVENNFLRDIYQVNTKMHGELYSLGSKIEKTIFKSGKLSIRNPQHQDLPTYEYKLNNINQNIDLVSASSAITELSPLIMYFRHKIGQIDSEMLIIDEPELSLHPDAQSKLVEIMVEAVNKGLKIILVTHSPYIIEALNNHLQRDKINNFKMSKKIQDFEGISTDKVSAYLFEDQTIKNILDDDMKLIDDKLLNSFNELNNIYDEMRDIEWDNISD